MRDVLILNECKPTSQYHLVWEGSWNKTLVKKRSPVLRRKFLVIFSLSKKWELNHPLKTFFLKITNKKNQNFEKIKLRIFVTQSLGICHGNVGYAVFFALQTSCFWLTS